MTRAAAADEAAILAALARLIDQERMPPGAVVHHGAPDAARESAYRGLGFGTVAFGAPPPPRSESGVTLIVPVRSRDTVRAVADAAQNGQNLDAAILPDPGAKALARFDRALFDRGLLRLAPRPGEATAIYLRSDLIRNVDATGGHERAVIAMSNFGHNAGFGNQIFQYAFLKLYGLRNNCAFGTPAWSGEDAFGLQARRVAVPRRRFKGDEWSVRDLALWSDDDPPVNVDFWGYFQNPPASWRRHRAFLRRLFTPRPRWRGPVEDSLARVRPAGATLVAIHMRRGDYRAYAPDKPWFRLIPEDWYRAWLARLWPTLENPILFIASDEREAVLPAFADFAPVTADAIEPLMPAPRELADLQVLAGADILAICNSSFSRAAALLAAEGQRCFIPSLAAEGFAPYDPWAVDHFWQRFGAPASGSRARSILPRWLRRRGATAAKR